MTNRRGGYWPYNSKSRMSGPHALSEVAKLFDDDDYGVYLLTSIATDGSEIVTYVGRGKLAARLRDHRRKEEGYVGFYYRRLKNDHAGFRAECSEFHRYGQSTHLDNEIHPRVPDGYQGDPCSVAACELLTDWVAQVLRS